VLHLPNFPARKVVQKMANMKMKKLVMSSKLMMSGTELIKEVIASLSALLREISLKGRNILSKRKAFRADRS
jgi:hypothetical protein